MPEVRQKHLAVPGTLRLTTYFGRICFYIIGVRKSKLCWNARAVKFLICNHILSHAYATGK